MRSVISRFAKNVLFARLHDCASRSRVTQSSVLSSARAEPVEQLVDLRPR